MKKVEKNTRTFRYDPNKITYDCTVELMNRFKGFDLVDRALKDLWMEIHNIVREAMTKTIPKKNKCETAKGLSKEALQIVEERREVKGKG